MLGPLPAVPGEGDPDADQRQESHREQDRGNVDHDGKESHVFGSWLPRYACCKTNLLSEGVSVADSAGFFQTAEAGFLVLKQENSELNTS